MKASIFVPLVLAIAGASLASPALAQVCPPAGQEWVRGLAGEWEVVDEEGAVVGTISLTEVSEPCAYFEVVREGERAPATTSHMWDETKQRWRQGAHFRKLDFDFVLRGSFADGVLTYEDKDAVLSHDTASNDDDCCFYQRRGTISGIGTETLRQEREISLDDGKSWTRLAPVEYRRIPAASR
ncbi:MAG: hypothetical protein ACSLFQ_07365 [Thermoanaerobaculia bacterium]